MGQDGAGLDVIDNGAIAARDGKIIYAGPAAGAPRDAAREVDCAGRWITPGLIDCHTHLVYAGSRAHEFEMRRQGASYAAIAQAGGGIAATVAATRAAGDAELLAASLVRADALMADGVTTLEIKSGYGLNLEQESKQLRVAAQIGQMRQVHVAPTLLAAHTLPPEFAGRADAYVTDICNRIIPAIAAQGLADAVDAFCESIAFSPDQVARVFAAARAQGLAVKLHAEQLSNQHGAALAARYGALSADHLEYLDAAGAAAMAQAGTIGVLLPGAFYVLRETQLPPVDVLRRCGVPMAVASDCNPGTSPLTSLRLAMNMAAILFGLSVEECLLGVTRHAAAALGRAACIGTLEPGKSCDLAIWDVAGLSELVYDMGGSKLHARIWKGQDA